MLISSLFKYALICIIICLIGVYVGTTVYVIRRSQVVEEIAPPSLPSPPELPQPPAPCALSVAVPAPPALPALPALPEPPEPPLPLPEAPVSLPAPPSAASAASPAPELVFASLNIAAHVPPPPPSSTRALEQNVSRSTILKSDPMPRRSSASVSNIPVTAPVPQLVVLTKADLTAIAFGCAETPSYVNACRDPRTSWSGCADLAAACVWSKYKSQSDSSLPTLVATKADMAAAVLGCVLTPSMILACGVSSTKTCLNRGVSCVWRRLTNHP